MIRLSAAALGLFAFAVTILLGLFVGNPPEATLLRAMWAMFVFFIIGLGVGWVSLRILDEHALRRNRELFPPDDVADEPAATTGSEVPGTADAPAETPAV